MQNDSESICTVRGVRFSVASRVRARYVKTVTADVCNGFPYHRNFFHNILIAIAQNNL